MPLARYQRAMKAKRRVSIILFCQFSFTHTIYKTVCLIYSIEPPKEKKGKEQEKEKEPAKKMPSFKSYVKDFIIFHYSIIVISFVTDFSTKGQVSIFFKLYRNK